jgi:hypothetical protein
MHARRSVSLVSALLTLAAVAAPMPARSAAPPDLTGLWRLDAQRSDTPPPPGERHEGGGGGHHGGGGGEGWGGGGGGRGGHHGSWGGGGGGGSAEGAPPEGARRTVPLPEVIHITETATIVSFEDSTGAVVQEITTLGGAKDTLAHAPGAPVIAGAWDDQALVISHPARGGTMTQTYSLEDGGRTLMVRSSFTGGPDGQLREFKRVYTRSSE